ncbi:MAG TPA: hypothetical protein VF755_19285 [Catenuloplanes sp.]|jgi:hypothetical protein
MTTGQGAVGPRYAGWLSPSRVALLGTVVVALLLVLPIYALGPGDHEKKSCGSALKLDLGPWRGFPADDYWDRAFQACTSQRVDRVAQAVGVVSATGLVTTLLAARRRRSAPESPAPSGGR